MSPLPTMLTNTQPFISNIATANRKIVSARGSGLSGATLPRSTIATASQTVLDASGYVFIGMGADGFGPFQLVKYTGSTTTSLTGCTGGTGTFGNASPYICQAYLNGPLRRIITITSRFIVLTTSDYAYVSGITDCGGSRLTMGYVGIAQWNPTTELDLFGEAVVTVDPGGAYGVLPLLGGGGSISLRRWEEYDL